MFRRLESITPAFLKKLDQNLLLNRPGLWATRIHYLLFFFSIGAGLLCIHLVTQQIRLNEVPSPDNNFLILLIPTAIGFLLWSYRASLFQVEKTFGHRENSKGLRDQFLYALVILLLAGAPLTYGLLQSQKIKNKISQTQLIEDLNALNLGESLFVTDSYYLHDGSFSKDSDQQIRQGKVVFNGFSRYTHYSFYDYNLYNETTLSDAVSRLQTRSEKLATIDAYIKTFNKYSKIPITLSAEKILSNYENQTWDYSQTKYEDAKYKVVRNQEMIQRAHTGKFNIMDNEFIPIYLFLMTFLWLALNVFLKTNWKTVAGAAILGIGSIFGVGMTYGLLQATMGIYEDNLIFGMGTLIFGILLYQAFRRKNTHRIKAWKSIALSAVAVATPIMPLMIISMFDSGFNNDEAEILMYTGIVAGILWWNLLYQRHFIKLESFPREN